MSFIRRFGRGVLWHFTIKTLSVLLSFSSRVRVVFYHPLPPGGYILATNHISHFDPPLITCNFPRRLDWIAMKELFHGRMLNAFFLGLRVIPVDRGGRDRTALRTATKRLAAGRVVGIFPEGGIRHGAASIINGAELKGGVAVLSEMTGAPIVPGVIIGSDRLYNKRNWLPWRPIRVWIGYGQPITTPAQAERGAANRSQIEKELSEAYREIRDRLQADFSIHESDLPHSPQERMAES